MTVDLNDVKTAVDLCKVSFELFKESIGLARRAKDSLPEGAEKKAVEKSLEEAESKSQIAEAQIARALGYELCQCTWPPQIMLRVGEDLQCPRCKYALSDSIVSVEKDFNVFD
jgi:hypothetical protein